MLVMSTVTIFLHAKFQSKQFSTSISPFSATGAEMGIPLSSFSQVAKAAFQRNNEALDAALFYLAIKKKAVLWGLFRYVQ